MITTSPEKGKDAKRLGAHEVLVSKDAAEMKTSKQLRFYLKYYSGWS
jgi:D-arabinose 1-dehydrogenase-like Zn-dependent alcohol dehydrogenase